MSRPVRIVALALAATAIACAPEPGRCRPDTLLLAVSLDADSAQADTLVVALSIDGSPPTQATLTNAGKPSGNIVVQFPHGYPRGHVVAIHVDAQLAGVVVGRGDASQPLVAACEVTPLSVSATVIGADLGVGADLLEPADLYVPPDMVCVPVAESGAACFDGVDNDCDGHTDCDDSDCTSTTQCVPPVSAGFTLGITVAQASFCPSLFTSLPALINSGLGPVGPDCPSTNCTCTPGMSCFSDVTSHADVACGGEGTGNTAASTCRGFSFASATKGVSTGPLTNNGGSCSMGGSSTRSATQWTTTERFCKADAVGGGCAGGMVCVPKLAVQTCAVADGAVACDTGYGETVGPWYTGLSDGRSCSCACGGASGGSCGTMVTFYGTNDCSGSSSLTMNLSQDNCTANGVYHSLKLASTLPSCGSPTTTLGGMLSGTGRQTLCCRP